MFCPSAKIQSSPSRNDAIAAEPAQAGGETPEGSFLFFTGGTEAFFYLENLGQILPGKGAFREVLAMQTSGIVG